MLCIVGKCIIWVEQIDFVLSAKLQWICYVAASAHLLSSNRANINTTCVFCGGISIYGCCARLARKINTDDWNTSARIKTCKNVHINYRYPHCWVYLATQSLPHLVLNRFLFDLCILSYNAAQNVTEYGAKSVEILVELAGSMAYTIWAASSEILWFKSRLKLLFVRYDCNQFQKDRKILLACD